MTDWSPGAYGRFRGFRLRPALDLLAQVPPLPRGDVVDLGCGAGAAAAELRLRFCGDGRSLLGVDTSASMLAEAGATGLYDRLDLADAAHWAPPERPALIFSNALLHWVADHGALMPRLAAMLAPGGTLAVQMPRQHAAPSHALLADLAREMFPDRFPSMQVPAAVGEATAYDRLLAPHGAVSAWETDYVQRLAPTAKGHPVRSFTESTAMRPYLAALSPDEAKAYVSRYELALDSAYPREPDGSVLFPFRRVFFVLTVPAGPAHPRTAG